MDHRMNIFVGATVVSIVCSATLLATTATRMNTPVYIAWLTTSLAFFCMGVCFAASIYLRAQTLNIDARTSLNADNADAHDNTAVSAGIEDPRNTYSLSTFYWCSPGLQNTTASVSASRTPETLNHQPLQGSSGPQSAAMLSSPSSPGLPPAAYFISSVVDLQRVVRVTQPLPTYQPR
ncbi:hypothetical protein DOTSEDRAFT_26914 [Dothistroma septosporum NZE10]|uniref:Uncharacterized protein n=1 Tax=Dothistroma septosporum (strain NZE10 / CBS 128990) TaxID=675120 RepID=N1PGP8_DOTSN|nr:hypothetical protein DOTSEDRAFT_26914 [Dothistroma septosporum NZE10]